jgi:hypothetical protein
MTTARVAAVVLLALLLPTFAHAEFRRIELKILGMD